MSVINGNVSGTGVHFGAAMARTTAMFGTRLHVSPLSATRTFGVEMEAVGITKAAAAKAIVNAGMAATVESYGHAVSDAWKIVPDGSVSNGWEAVSPIMQGNEGLCRVWGAANALKAAGASANRSCGLHVHIHVADYNLQQIKAIVLRYAKMESLLPAITNREGGHYSQRLTGTYQHCADYATLFARVKAATDVRQVWEAYAGRDCGCTRYGSQCRCPRRYYSINFGTYFTTGCIEFRQGAGTVDAERICSWILLLLALVEQSRNTVPGMLKPAQYSRETFLSHLNFKNWVVMAEDARLHIKRAIDSGTLTAS